MAISRQLLGLHILLLFLLCRSIGISAESNAQRMAKGLPPSKPQHFGRTVPGYSSSYVSVLVDRPTRVVKTRPSSSPSVAAAPGKAERHSTQGRVQVRTTADKQVLGYMARSQDGVMIGLARNIDDEKQLLTFKFDSTGQLEIFHNDGSVIDALGTSVLDSKDLGSLGSNSLDQNHLDGDHYEASAVWYFNPLSRQIKSWPAINNVMLRSEAPSQLIYNREKNQILSLSDTKIDTHHVADDAVTVVDLYLEDL